jgi:formiminotetrahydrofolate cyclodeaminase
MGAGRDGPAEALPAYLEMPLADFLAALGSGHAAPGGGSAAAASVALGGRLCAMTARLSARQLGGSPSSELTAQADRLSQACAALIQADAESFRQVLAARGRTASPDAGSDPQLDPADLSAAAAVPLSLMELALPVVRLAARLATDGNSNLRGDALTGMFLAAAGARAAAVLVGINVGGADSDQARQARQLLDAITETVATVAQVTP